MSTAPVDVLRVQPPYGALAALLRNRDKVASGTPGKLTPNDLTVVSGRGIARQWQLVAGLPVDHGTTLADWERRPLGGALEGLATSGHTHAISAITGLQPELDALGTAVASKQAALSNATALARISAVSDGPPKWDDADWPGGGGTSSPIDKTGLEHWWEIPWLRSAHTDGADLVVGSVPALDTGYFPGHFSGRFSASYLYFPSAASVQIGAGSFAVAMWVRHTAFGGDQSYVQKWDYAATNDEWACYPSNSGYPRFSLRNSANTAGQELTSTQILSVGRWHHLVFVYDSSAPESRIYVDGAAAGALTIAGGIRNSNAKMVVGTWGTTAGGVDSEYLNGSIADLSVWHRVLTPAEISMLATPSAARYV